MYKNQKTYFSDTITATPRDVIEKSNKIISERQNRKPQKIKVITKEKKKVKGVKELEREKLMKLYGKNNNMISLLILLLKRGENKKEKKQYKSKRIYGRGGYKQKGNDYLTKTQLDKQRKTETTKADKIKKDEVAFKESSKLLKQATNPNISPSQRQLLLEQAEKIASDRITEEEFEKYKGYVSGASAEPPTKRAVLDIKEAVQKEITKSEEFKREQLKKKQNEGRLKTKAEKDKRYKEFIDDIVFSEIIPKEERDDYFKRFKLDNPDISKPSYDSFMKLFNPKYSEFKKNFQDEGQQQAKKISKVQQRKLKIKEFIEAIKFTEQPSKRDLKKLVDDFKVKYPDIKNQPSKNELQSFIKITSVSDSGSEISKSADDMYLEVDDFINSNFKDKPSKDQVDIGLEKLTDFLSEKELEKSKTTKKEDKEKISKSIIYGTEQLALLTQRGQVISELDKRYPIEDLKQRKLPNFKDFSIYDDDYETEYLKRIKKEGAKVGTNYPELEYLGTPVKGSDSSSASEPAPEYVPDEEELEQSDQSILESPSQIRRQNQGRFDSESEQESSSSSSDSVGGVGGNLGDAIKAALGE